jgi:4-amino-4-deoxy-L-arabinose transferase-like glycosyltransferase
MTEPARRLPSWLAPAVVFVLGLFALVPTTGDIGLTWDEPSYRYSQILSEQWWTDLAHARTADALGRLFDADALLYYWPYGRFGINFHPPLAGQLNLLTYELFGRWMKDIPARRMASVIEFALTMVILYQFLSRRYGGWVGGVAAASLLLMPRLYAHAHIAGTDTPGLLLWAATAVAFWKGMVEPNARWWRVGVGVLLGLAFVEKMGAVMVAVPLLIWLGAGLMSRKPTRAGWIDGLVTSVAMLIPLGLAYREIARLAEVFFNLQRKIGIKESDLSLSRVNLFRDHPAALLPSGILLVPLGVWLIRRLLGRIFRKSPVWGVERPGLETWTAMLAFGPVVAWLGNPAWWRETLPRLAHYYALNAGRRGALPDIWNLYFGQRYEYSLPWHNAWVLIAITVPVGILLASIVGLVLRIVTIRRDRVPLYFLLHLTILPILRMLPTPAHDGVRLFLPTFFFLAAFAGWGVVGLADLIARSPRWRVRGIVAIVVLGPAVWALIRIHPFELSYYNEWIGGPRGAWAKGFELTYWYEAFNGETLADLNRVIPDGTPIDTLNEMTRPPTFACLQELGAIKPSLMIAGLDDPKRFPSAWIVPPGEGPAVPKRLDFAIWIATHDSKATPLTRLAFAMTPLYERRPRQLDGLRVVTVDSHETVKRAWALDLLTDPGPAPLVRDAPAAPGWVRSVVPPLARFWGDGVTRSKPLRINESVFDWAKSDPESLRDAARGLAPGGTPSPDSDRLRALITHRGLPEWSNRLAALLDADPKSFRDAVEILIAHPDAVRTVLTRYGYTDPSEIGGPLDRNLVKGQS